MNLRRPTCQSLIFACVTLVAGCVWDPALDGYPSCRDGCPEGCSCLAGQACVPDEPGRPPGFCDQHTQDCKTDADCDHGCLCQDGKCVPPHETPDPDFCRHGEMTCVTHQDCRTGCTCTGNVCRPPSDDPNHAYCAGEGPELTCLEPTHTVSDEEELRNVLHMAADEPGPYGIVFQVPEGELTVSEDLPPVPSLTWIGGPERCRLRARGATTGLTVAGTGVVLRDLEILGFPGSGVVIQGGSADVHLYRMRIGDAAAPNGTGIRIEPGTERIAVGRGRELGPARCVEAVTTDFVRQGDLAAYDVNVIAGNNGDGILAREVEDLLVEGTWVGFDTLGDRGSDGWERGNSGTGIHLDGVQGAYIGIRHVEQDEIGSSLDHRQGCVAVGRSGAGGVHIQGGGDIRMHCLIVGDTPVMDPWEENHGFGLRIEQTTGEVAYGPAPDATGFMAASMGLVHTETVPAIEIVDTRAPVQVRGAQIQSLFSQGGSPPCGVEITNAAAPVEILHVDLVGDVLQAFVCVNELPEEGRFHFVNNVVFGSTYADVPVLQITPETAPVEIHHNLKWDYGPWCAGDCSFPVDPQWSVEGGVSGCVHDLMKPESSECPMVDRGHDTGMDVNGAHPENFSGCCPDLGAFECVTPDCENVICDEFPCP